MILDVGKRLKIGVAAKFPVPRLRHPASRSIQNFSSISCIDVDHRDLGYGPDFRLIDKFMELSLYSRYLCARIFVNYHQAYCDLLHCDVGGGYTTTTNGRKAACVMRLQDRRASSAELPVLQRKRSEYEEPTEKGRWKLLP